MDWSKGISATFYAAEIDRNTWRPRERFEIKGGSIKRVNSGLMETADIACKNYDRGEIWVRIYMIAKQDQSSESIPLFTGLASAPDDDIQGYRIENQVNCSSVLKPCEDVLLPIGWYVASGVKAETVLRELLSVTPAPVVIAEDSPVLMQNIVAESGESHLTMIENILQTINWRLWIGGDGTIHIEPKAKEPSVRFSSLDNDSIEPVLKRSHDWYSCPNVFQAVADDESVIVKDDDPDSPLSTVNRGREIWMQETSCTLSDGESLEAYTRRRLKEEQRVAVTVSYDRRFMPDVRVSDIVTLYYPAQKLNGNYMVTSQSIEIKYGARTSEEVVKV